MRIPSIRFIVTGLLFLIVSYTASPSHAAARFTRVVTFGDSLTHNDVLHLRSRLPRKMYGKDPMEAVFRKGMARGEKLRNFAVAGSFAVESSDHPLNIARQVDVYEFLLFIGRQKEATFVSFEIGGNDIINDIQFLVSADEPQGERLINDIIADIEDSWLRLRNLLPNAQFLIWTVPDVTLTPKLSDLSDVEAANVRAHIERVNLFISSLAVDHRVLVFDHYTIMQELVAVPPVVAGQVLVPPPENGHFNDLFADNRHPTAVSNALVANEMIKRINEHYEDTIPLYSEQELAALAQPRRR
jgi:phospholipase/lecithinase/hemolysin